MFWWAKWIDRFSSTEIKETYRCILCGSLWFSYMAHYSFCTAQCFQMLNLQNLCMWITMFHNYMHSSRVRLQGGSCFLKLISICQSNAVVYSILFWMLSCITCLFFAPFLVLCVLAICHAASLVCFLSSVMWLLSHVSFEYLRFAYCPYGCMEAVHPCG